MSSWSFVPVPGPDGVRRYGYSLRPEDPARCRMARVIGNVTHQCRRRRGHGSEHAFCCQHAAILRRQEAGA